MLEMIFLTVLLFLALAVYVGYPFIRHFRNYQHERAMLEKKYNRLYKSRKDLLVSSLLKHDWLKTRLEPLRLGNF